MSLSVDDNLNAVVRAPYFVSDAEITEFVNSHNDWLAKTIQKKQKFINRTQVGDEKKQEMIKYSKEIIPKRVEHYSSLMNLSPANVKITSAKKRFGSCSSNNSLCFSFYLADYPIEAIDYVVVHELAHIVHRNHGREFYSLIEKYLPDYKEREKLLK